MKTFTSQQHAKRELWQVLKSYLTAGRPGQVPMSQQEATELTVLACKVFLSDSHTPEQIERFIPLVLSSVGLDKPP